MYKLFFYLFLIGIIISCNPAKRLNEAVKQRNEAAANKTIVKIPVAITTPENINYIYDYENLYSQE